VCDFHYCMVYNTASQTVLYENSKIIEIRQKTSTLFVGTEALRDILYNIKSLIAKLRDKPVGQATWYVVPIPDPFGSYYRAEYDWLTSKLPWSCL
jgi:hypothetical protein